MVPMKKPRRATLVLWIVVVTVVGVLTTFYVTDNPLRNRIFTKTLVGNTRIPPSLGERAAFGWRSEESERIGEQMALHPVRVKDGTSMPVVKRWPLLPLPNWKNKSTCYYLENGMVAAENWNDDGSISCFNKTLWGFDGNVFLQTRITEDGFEYRHSPPWWWGVHDQTEPKDPVWIAEHGKPRSLPESPPR